MARKGREPLAEAPPPAASSSEEEDSGEDEEETHSSSTEEEEEDEAAPPSASEKPSSVKKTTTQKKTEPSKPATESDSDSETDSDDSDMPPTVKVKPIASKPMEESPKVKKSGSKVAGKRPALDSEKGTAKKGKSESTPAAPAPAPAPAPGQAQAQEEGKKVGLFQRLWSEEDELVILRGIMDYKAKKNIDPLADPDDFLEFIKKNLDFVGANRAQIVNKIQRLRKKYSNARKKKKYSNARKKTITNPHELKAFELSKQVWGGANGVEDNGVGDDKNPNLNASNVKSSRPSSSKSKAASKVGVNGLVLESEKNMESEKTTGVEEYVLSNWMISRCEREMLMSRMFGGFDEGLLKEGMKLLGEKEKADLIEKWKKHNVAEMELYLKRLDLIKETTQKTVNAVKSADH